MDASVRPVKYENQEKAWGNKGIGSAWGQKGKWDNKVIYFFYFLGYL